MKKIIILGSTGSIGKQTLEIIKKDKKKFRMIKREEYSHRQKIPMMELC